jgi:hypothetical protein
MKLILFLAFLQLPDVTGAQTTYTPGTKGAYGTGGSYVTPATTKSYSTPSNNSSRNSPSSSTTPSHKASDNYRSTSSGRSPSQAPRERTKTPEEQDAAAMKEYNENIAAYRKEMKAISSGLAAKPIFCASCKTSITDVRAFVKGINNMLSMDSEAPRKILDYASTSIHTDQLRQLTEVERILLFNGMETGMKFYAMPERTAALNAIRSVAMSGSKSLKRYQTGSLGQERYGYKNVQGTIVVQAIYVDAQEFAEGLAAVCTYDALSQKSWGFIDMNGNTVIPFDYKHAGSFGQYSAGLASVSPDGSTFYYIDKTGARK